MSENSSEIPQSEIKINYDGTIVGGGSEEQKKDALSQKITEADIRPEVPDIGGTVLVVQVNARDNRESEVEFGALTAEARRKTAETAERFFNGVFAGLDEEEKSKVDIAVFASDANLKMLGGVDDPHRRAMETAQIAMEVAGASLKLNGLDPAINILNNSSEGGGKPLPVPEWADLKMWEAPEFVDYLQKLWGTKEFWSKYESDWIGEAGFPRAPLTVETQQQIAARTNSALTELTVAFARNYHQEHPGRRLIIWADGMYDNVSPWVKRYVQNKDPSKTFLPMEKGSGITVKIDPQSKEADTKIGNVDYKVPSLLRQNFNSYITDYEKPKG